jgi:hypothetical protein
MAAVASNLTGPSVNKSQSQRAHKTWAPAQAPTTCKNTPPSTDISAHIPRIAPPGERWSISARLARQQWVRIGRGDVWGSTQRPSPTTVSGSLRVESSHPPWAGCTLTARPGASYGPVVAFIGIALSTRRESNGHLRIGPSSAAAAAGDWRSASSPREDAAQFHRQAPASSSASRSCCG